MIADPQVPGAVDHQGIDRFLTYNHMPGPETLLCGVRKIDPGHYLVCQKGETRTQRYWDLAMPREAHRGTVREVTEELIELLRQTVRQHMLSDVPIGVLLSGGVDSTGILSFCVEEAESPVRAFTVGFDDEDVTDERPYARLASQRYGTDHHEMTITAQVFGDFLPKYVWHMEEPVCEPPAIACGCGSSNYKGSSTSWASP